MANNQAYANPGQVEMQQINAYAGAGQQIGGGVNANAGSAYQNRWANMRTGETVV